ncbi:MAG TPA: membrane protein insertion efficiency factor YidD [Acidimicrobiales bacterium]|nr:membrane protein insertion efficiency factor YidD [Acidimicrobiales bacterium]HUB69227.1 membrane protein insertion efficiency factor YidD [Acidimicrobiales bacterium]
MTDKPRSVASRALVVLVQLYRGATANRAAACRFVPSCSQYALDALRLYPLRQAVPLVLRRLARCRPGGPFGFDPVPEATSLGESARLPQPGTRPNTMSGSGAE